MSVGTVGGERRVVNVAAGTTATDAVNLAQLNAVSTFVTVLQGQVTTNLSAINAVQAVNTSQSTQIAEIQTVNTSQSTQIGTLNSQVGAINNNVAGLQAGLNDLFESRTSDWRDMKQGVAAAIAIANASMPSAPGKLSYAINGAMFRGEAAAGGSLMYRLPTNNPMAINVGISHAGKKNQGVRVGVAGEF